MSLNFKNVDMPKDMPEYVQPGFWTLAPISAELIATGKTPYAKITFESDKGKLVEKFYLTEKSLPRLQYLHFALYGKRIEKDFTNDEFVTYLNTLFNKKNIPLNLKVGGEIGTDGKVYSRLVFNNFVIDADNFEEGAFTEGSARYNEVVKKSTYNGNSPQTDDVVLPGAPKNEAPFPWDE